MNDLNYEDLESVFHHGGSTPGISSLVDTLRTRNDHHGLFRSLLLKKRHELKLPLINPGDLKGADPDVRRKYEDYVEEVCREVGLLYLKDGDLPQAFRYLRTIGEEYRLREALEKADTKEASDDLLTIAVDHGVHPVRGFEFILARDGLCRAITTFDSFVSHSTLAERKTVAAMLVQHIYRDLVVGVGRQIQERFGELPPETDLVELIRHRPWLFENNNTHSDPSHIAAIARESIICDTQEARIAALSICEYGKLLGSLFKHEGRPPFENGYADYALYLRALLGENAESAIREFNSRLDRYEVSSVAPETVEAVVSLMWRCGHKDEALNLWQQHLRNFAPDQPGRWLPSYYELCIEAEDYWRLAEAAREQSDVTAWAAGRILEYDKQYPMPETTD